MEKFIGRQRDLPELVRDNKKTYSRPKLADALSKAYPHDHHKHDYYNGELSSFHRAIFFFQKKLQSIVQPFSQEERTQQQEMLSSLPSDDEESETDRILNRLLAIGATSFGLACLGAVLYPPLSLLSWPGLFYVTRYSLTEAYKMLVEKRASGAVLLSNIVRVLLFLNGYYVLCSLSAFSYTLNEKLLNKVKDNSKKNVIDVFRQRSYSVFMLSDGYEIEVPFTELKKGDIVVIHAGETIPADGTITHGMASIDQHILTGEAQPVEKAVGDPVFGLTMVLTGRIYVQVEKTGGETTAAQIGDILNKTVEYRTEMQLWSERMTNKTILPTILMGLSVMPLIGLIGSVAFLDAHPKFRTIIAGSMSVLSVLNVVSQKGILIKDGRTFELLAQIDTVVFDKTGTLTKEEPHVGQIHSTHRFTAEKVLWYAAAAEYKQSHPVAKAILQEAKRQGLDIPEISEAEYKVGYGITMTLDYQVVRVGSVRFMEMEDIVIPSEIRVSQEACHQAGHTLVFVALADQVIGALELHATIRPEAEAVIQGLRQRNIRSIYIISGDHEAPTKRLADSLGIDHYFAETLPEEKATIIEQLQQEGKSVCYIGDGINDAIALKKAQVSVSLRGASTLATDTAQVILMDQSLSQLCPLFDIARRFQANMKKTFAIIFIPHIVALAGVLFANFGFLTVFVLGNLSMFAGVAHAMISTHLDQNLEENDC